MFVTCTFIGFLAAVLPIDKLWDLVSIGTLAAFIVVSATVIILRQTRPDLERGFSVPRYPVIPLLSIAACIYVGTTDPGRHLDARRRLGRASRWSFYFALQPQALGPARGRME